MKKNIGEKERTVRILVGLPVLVATATGYIVGVPAIIAALAAAILVTTGLLNYCPLYAMLKCSSMAGMPCCPTDKKCENKDEKIEG